MASSEQLEREAQAARARIEETLVELRTRVSPGRILDEWMNRTTAMTSKMKKSSRRAIHQAESTAEQASKSGSTVFERARGLTKFLADEPVVVAGLGIALGAIVGALLPATEIENRAMGEAGDRLKRDTRSDGQAGDAAGADAPLVPSGDGKKSRRRASAQSSTSG